MNRLRASSFNGGQAARFAFSRNKKLAIISNHDPYKASRQDRATGVRGGGNLPSSHRSNSSAGSSGPTLSPVPSTINLSLRNKNQAYLTAADLEGSGADLTLLSLTNCVIDLRDETASLVNKTPSRLLAVYGRDLKRCLIMLPIVEGSVRLEGCSSCTIAVACHQVTKFVPSCGMKFS